MHARRPSLGYVPPGSQLLLAATVTWTVAVPLSFLGVVVVPASALALLIAAVPLATWAAFFLSQEPDVGIRLAAAWTGLVVAAFVITTVVTAQPLLAIAFPVLLASAAFCARFPATAAVTAFTLSGFYGSLKAFTGVSGNLIVDIVLVGLWVGVILSHLAKGQVRRTLIWPSMAAVALYIAFSTAQVLTTPDVVSAFLSYRLSIWYLLVIILLAYAGWERITYTRIARGVVVACGLVGAYADLRYFIGPAAQERALALQVGGGFNFVLGQLRDFGSFNAGHQLGFWTAVTGPFCLAAMLGWRGRWRAIAGVSFALVTFAVLASQVRGALIGLVLGVGLVLLLFQLARSSPGLKLGRNAGIAAASVVLIGGALLFTAGSKGKLDRYTAIFHPSSDPAYVDRLNKGAEGLKDIAAHPLGQGLGTASLNPSIRSSALSIGTFSLDNSFLKVGFEQGIPGLVLFAAALLLLLRRTSTSSLRVRDGEVAAMGIASAGALLSAIAVFYSGMYFEDLIALGAWIVIGLGPAFLIREESEALAAREARSRTAIGAVEDAMIASGRHPGLTTG